MGDGFVCSDAGREDEGDGRIARLRLARWRLRERVTVGADEGSGGVKGLAIAVDNALSAWERDALDGVFPRKRTRSGGAVEEILVENSASRMRAGVRAGGGLHGGARVGADGLNAEESEAGKSVTFVDAQDWVEIGEDNESGLERGGHEAVTAGLRMGASSHRELPT